MEQRKKVLIIDDEVDLCLLMKSYFLRKNYEVYITHTLPVAFQLVKENKPDTIFLNSKICSHPNDNIKSLKEAAPDTEFIMM